jgi:hypothetical protein
MKKIIATFCFSISVSFQAAAAAPSDASLNELMVITNTPQMVEGIYAQMDRMMESMLQQSIKDTKLNQAQQKAIDNQFIVAWV